MQTIHSRAIAGAGAAPGSRSVERVVTRGPCEDGHAEERNAFMTDNGDWCPEPVTGSDWASPSGGWALPDHWWGPGAFGDGQGPAQAAVVAIGRVEGVVGSIDLGQWEGAAADSARERLAEVVAGAAGVMSALAQARFALSVQAEAVRREILAAAGATR